MPRPSFPHARAARTRPPRARRASPAALLLIAALADCGERTGEAGTRAAEGAAAEDTSALAVARRQLGSGVRQATPFTLRDYTGRFIAAALPVPGALDDPLRPGVSVAAGSHEIVILEMPDTSVTHAITKPGLYVSAPAEVPPDEALRELSGVDDMNGDGDAEVWSVQHGGPDRPYVWEIRAYDRGGRTLHQLAARRGPDGATEPDRLEPSDSLEAEPDVLAWLTEKLQALATRFPGTDGTAAGGGR